MGKEEVRRKIIFMLTIFGLMMAFMIGLMLIQVGTPSPGGYTPDGRYIPPREGNPYALYSGYALISIVVLFALKIGYTMLIKWTHWRFDLIYTRIDRNPRNNYLIKAAIVSVDPLTSTEVKAALGYFIPEPIAYYADKMDWRLVTYTGEEDGVMIIGSSIPYEALGEYIPDAIYVGNIPVRTNVRDLEAIELVRISWDSIKMPNIPAELKRKLMFLPRKRYNILEPEVTSEFFDHKSIPVLIITGSSEIAQRQKEGIFAIERLGEDPRQAQETLREIVEQAKAKILDTSEAEKKMLRDALDQVIHKRIRTLKWDLYANPPKIYEAAQPMPPGVKLPSMKSLLKIIAIGFVIMLALAGGYALIKVLLAGVIP